MVHKSCLEGCKRRGREGLFERVVEGGCKMSFLGEMLSLKF